MNNQCPICGELITDLEVEMFYIEHGVCEQCHYEWNEAAKSSPIVDNADGYDA